jgi:hypothetical protein
MMTAKQRARLVDILDEVSLVGVFEDVDDLARRIEEFARHYAKKAKGVAKGALPETNISLDALLAEFRGNPLRVQALLQAMAFLCTPEMLVMIWMSELGCAIQKLTLDYEHQNHALLEVELRLLDGTPLKFSTSEVWDFAVLRLVGLGTANGQPVIGGFYPLFFPDPSVSQTC